MLVSSCPRRALCVLSGLPPFMSFLPLFASSRWLNTHGMLTTLIPSIHADHPDGALNLSQRSRLTAALLAARWMRPRRTRRRPSGLAKELGNPAVWTAIESPQGQLANRAWALAYEHQPAWLVNHALRTHVWGQALGVIDGLSPDKEVLFAAAMLHDVGLTPAAAHPPHHCFSIRSARYAKDHLSDATDAAKLNVVAEAIARHLDLQVSLNDGVEAHLLQAGAMADVVGQGIAKLPAPMREHVVSTHPRLGMKVELCRCMAREAAAAPHSRAACYVRRIDFLNLIRHAPYEE